MSIDEPLNVDWDGNELLLSDILGTEEDVISRGIEDEGGKIAAAAWLSQSCRDGNRGSWHCAMGWDERDGNEMTQKEVADLMGISQSYISRLEKKIIHQLKKEIVQFQ